MKLYGTLPIITDSPIQEAWTQEKLNRAISYILKQIAGWGSKLPRNAELYVRVDRSSEECAYYFVDHDTQTEFWVQDIKMEDLGMPSVSSIWHISKGNNCSCNEK